MLTYRRLPGGDVHVLVKIGLFFGGYPGVGDIQRPGQPGVKTAQVVAAQLVESGFTQGIHDIRHLSYGKF